MGFTFWGIGCEPDSRALGPHYAPDPEAVETLGFRVYQNVPNQFRV